MSLERRKVEWRLIMRIVRLLISSFTFMVVFSAFNPTFAADPHAAMQSNVLAVPVKDIQRFATVIAQIKRYYIEPVDDKVLFDNAIRGMLTNLDPHSDYLDVDTLRDLQSVTTGEFS